MWKLETDAQRFELRLDGRLILRHSPERPALYLGRGREKIAMFRGNFDIGDRVEERFALRLLGRAEDGALRFGHPDLAGEYRLTFREEDGVLRLRGVCEDKSVNRLWLRFAAEPGEHVTGGGEQFSALDLRGRLWPIWTREQGVGRNKLTEITRLADAADGGGGDYHTTFFPQPTFVSSRLYFAHLENYDYAELDFRAEDFHELGVWSPSISLCLAAAGDYAALLGKLTGLLGRQPMLPCGWACRAAPSGRARWSAAALRTALICPPCGSRTGRADASPPSASACSGTGAGTGRCTPGSTP